MNIEASSPTNFMHLHFKESDPSVVPVLLYLKDRYFGPSMHLASLISCLKSYGFKFEKTGANTYVCMNSSQVKQLKVEDVQGYLDEMQSIFMNVDIQEVLCQNGKLITIATIWDTE